MTMPELIAFAIGAALATIAWMACHWATIAARTPRTPDPVESEGAARPAGDESCPEGYVPLSRMSREEVQQHLQRLKPDWTPPTVRTVDLSAPEEER